MATRCPTPRQPDLRIIPGGLDAGVHASPAAKATARPVLMGLIICEAGGPALGVVREVVSWDGAVLTVGLLPDPAAGLGMGLVEMQVRLARAEGQGP